VSTRCILALEDGTVFTGSAFGARGTRAGEVVFNTALTGYQEILTDPSYRGQIVAMTYPHIGNYGVNDADVEALSPQVAGFVVRELTRQPSNHRANQPLEPYLARHGIVAIEGIDTRALTRLLRVHGAMNGVLTTEQTDPARCVELARAAPSMTGADLVREVMPREAYDWHEGLSAGFGSGRAPARTARRVVAVDCGMKRNILRHLVDIGARVHVVPPTAKADDVLALKPDGVFVSNGPGDPAAVTYAVDLLRGLIGKTPMFGICLGHQLLGLALHASSFKLKFGHRGANQPVLNTATARVEITSQNHGFAIDADSICAAGATVTHVNLNDRTLEGFVHPDLALLAVQYHPEASPGPHDATYLFDCFARMMDTGRAPTAGDMAAAQSALQQRFARADSAAGAACAHEGPPG